MYTLARLAYDIEIFFRREIIFGKVTEDSRGIFGAVWEWTRIRQYYQVKSDPAVRISLDRLFGEVQSEK